MGDGLALRPAVRAIIIDELDRVLLVRFDFGHRTIWATPGGGLEADENDEDALRRELAEEVGLLNPVIGSPVWVRTHVFPMSTGHDGQLERFYLVKCRVLRAQASVLSRGAAG